jgi:hypothetical protein
MKKLNIKNKAHTYDLALTDSAIISHHAYPLRLIFDSSLGIFDDTIKEQQSKGVDSG